MSKYRKLTHAELLAEAKERFGDDPLDIAFRCPRCGDVATIRDFPEDARNRAGQECIGRSIGATRGELSRDSKEVQRGQAERGCDWAAYGLFHGPWEIVMDDGRSVWGFPLADAPVTQAAGGAA